MADRGLIKRMVDDGMDPDDAVAQVDSLVDVIRSQLLSGKTVTLEGIGRLSARKKPANAGYPPHMLVERRKVAITGTVIEQGEPYPDPKHVPGTRSPYLPRR